MKKYFFTKQNKESVSQDRPDSVVFRFLVEQNLLTFNYAAFCLAQTKMLVSSNLSFQSLTHVSLLDESCVVSVPELRLTTPVFQQWFLLVSGPS